MMFTTDLALRYDPEYGKITKRFLENPKEFELAFAKAWFKLTHRDMGPKVRYVGSEVPKETLIWQDPIPKANYRLLSNMEVQKLKSKILRSGVTVSDLVKTAWASASTYRGTDMRGGANGGRVRLSPQNKWKVNDPDNLRKVIAKLDSVRKDFNQTLPKGKMVSLADTIVLAGNAAVEIAAKRAGVPVKVPFRVGRTDATQAETDIKSFSNLEPYADGFRNYYSKDAYYSPVVSLIDRAALLTLTVPEMTVLIGGLRVLGANTGSSKNGVFTSKIGVLTPDFSLTYIRCQLSGKNQETITYTMVSTARQAKSYGQRHQWT